MRTYTWNLWNVSLILYHWAAPLYKRKLERRGHGALKLQRKIPEKREFTSIAIIRISKPFCGEDEIRTWSTPGYTRIVKVQLPLCFYLRIIKKLNGKKIYISEGKCLDNYHIDSNWTNLI